MKLTEFHVIHPLDSLCTLVLGLLREIRLANPHISPTLKQYLGPKLNTPENILVMIICGIGDLNTFPQASRSQPMWNQIMHNLLGRPMGVKSSSQDFSGKKILGVLMCINSPCIVYLFVSFGGYFILFGSYTPIKYQ